MKAMILAAGLGTRLQPHTLALPKPLFPIAGEVMLDRLVAQLADAGATAVMINTHHLHRQIEEHIASRKYPVDVQTRFEQQILGTGGAIKNIADWWRKQEPLLLINGDIVTDIDLSKVYRFHRAHEHPITMVMHDFPEFNGVTVNLAGFISEFGQAGQPASSADEVKLAYTGIQVLDPTVLDWIPAATFCSIIDIYEDWLRRNGRIAAFIARNHRWHDMGSIAGLRKAVLYELARQVFTGVHTSNAVLKEIPLAGDGSDRKWSRLESGSATAVLVDHGIVGHQKRSEAASVIRIGRHLASKQVAVPTVLAADVFSGLVIMEDLGDEHLQTRILATAAEDAKEEIYKNVIRQLIVLSIQGFEAFDPKWTYQTERYDQTLILERECRYFMEAFINGYLHIEMEYEELRAEFETLAQSTVENAIWGLMHRDCQSRNIMWLHDQCRFIDFQGARIGPIQYDLASLLIDPYVALSENLQNKLLTYYDALLCKQMPQWAEKWQTGYACCRLTRNLQILGAFGFLSRVKAKPFFTQFIPNALETLRKSLNETPISGISKLTRFVSQLPAIPS